MRVTLSLDPDISAKARDEAARLGQPLDQVANSALRIGLKQLLKPAPTKPYKTKACPLGLNEGLSYDNVAELLARTEGENVR
jgi:hypothetical protein